MKKAITIILIICVILFLGVYLADLDAFFHGKVRLSSLDNEQCKQFLLEQGVTIPDEFSQLDFQNIFADIEDDPNISFVLGWMDLGDFLKEIRDAVNAYYGISIDHS